METLVGHDSPETAYVVDDYPYGFRLRTKIRYWIETNKRKGQRFVSQTVNPKYTDREIWNKPKASTYSTLMVMYLDEKGHVHQDGVGMYSMSELDNFIERHGGEDAPAFADTYRQSTIRGLRAAIKRMEGVTWTVTTREIDPWAKKGEE